MSDARLEATSRHTHHPAVGLGIGAALALAALVFGLSELAALPPLPVAAATGAAAAGAFWLLSRRDAPRPSGAAPSSSSDSDTARRLMEIVTDTAPEAVLFFSDAGAIRYANASARELFFDGKSPEGENFIRLVAEAPPALREALLGETDRLFTVELEGRHETFHVSRRTFTLDDSVHTLLAVKYLTREIARREVEVLKRVVRVISHEVNNSLAPISSLVHSARQIAKLPEHANKLERAFDTIEDRAAHLKSFLEGYAALARLPAPRPRRVEWQPFLRQVSELYPKITLESAPEEPGWFDPTQIEQVVINLIKNAQEAGSDPGTIELGIRVARDGTAEIEVRDRGPGFGSEALKNALLPLYTTKDGGSGMGLSLSQEIVEAHGGSLALMNRKDGGATIRVSLPGKPSPASPSMTHSRLTLVRSQPGI
jgi:two-component system, NtrC family, nitrogen regulation sensor histidine kinase NtrY